MEKVIICVVKQIIKIKELSSMSISVPTEMKFKMILLMLLVMFVVVRFESVVKSLEEVVKVEIESMTTMSVVCLFTFLTKLIIVSLLVRVC